MIDDRMTKEEFLANRKAAGRDIDIENCAIWQTYCQILDPYGIDPPPDEYNCGGEGNVRRIR